MQHQLFYSLTDLILFLYKILNKYVISIALIKRETSQLIDQYFNLLYKQIQVISILLDEKRALINVCNSLQAIMKKLQQETIVSKDHMKANTKIAVIKEMTIRSLEPHVGNLVTKHKREIERLNSTHLIELSNVQFQLKNGYDHNVKLLHEKNIIDAKRIQRTTTNEMFIIVNKKLDHIKTTFRNKRFLLVKELNLLKLKLRSINAEILIERACIVETIKHEVNSTCESIIKNMYVILNSVKGESRYFWLKEIQKSEREREQMCDQRLLEKEHELCTRLKLDQELEIERIIKNLEQSFNEDKKREQLHHIENISLLKARYEKQIFDLMQSNAKFEGRHCGLSRCFHCKIECGEALESFPSPHNEPFHYSNVSQEQYSSILLENSHLKHYIKELELRIK